MFPVFVLFLTPINKKMCKYVALLCKFKYWAIMATDSSELENENRIKSVYNYGFSSINEIY